MNEMHKSNARQAMQKCSPTIYIVTALVTYLPVLMEGCFGLIVFGDALGWAAFAGSGSIERYERYFELLNGFQMVYFFLGYLLLRLVASLLSYGYTYHCLKASRNEETSWHDLMYGFNEPVRVILAELFMSVRIFVLTLCFIIPGIRAGFSYSQTYRVMIDDPNLTPWEAINVSRDLMEGERMELFLLELSFIGWSLLSTLQVMILPIDLVSLYVKPYVHCAISDFYNARALRLYMAPPVDGIDGDEWQ